MLVVASRKISSSPVFRAHFDFRFRFGLLNAVVETFLSHKYLLPSHECIFSAKSFSLENLSLLTKFQKLPAVYAPLGVGTFAYLKGYIYCNVQPQQIKFET